MTDATSVGITPARAAQALANLVHDHGRLADFTDATPMVTTGLGTDGYIAESDPTQGRFLMHVPDGGLMMVTITRVR